MGKSALSDHSPLGYVSEENAVHHCFQSFQVVLQHRFATVELWIPGFNPHDTEFLHEMPPKLHTQFTKSQ